MTLEKEAEIYADNVIGFSNENHNQWEDAQRYIIGFCEESKWIEYQKIKAQIDILIPFVNGLPRYEYPYNKIGQKIIQLEEQLKLISE